MAETLLSNLPSNSSSYNDDSDYSTPVMPPATQNISTVPSTQTPPSSQSPSKVIAFLDKSAHLNGAGVIALFLAAYAGQMVSIDAITSRAGSLSFQDGVPLRAVVIVLLYIIIYIIVSKLF